MRSQNIFEPLPSAGAWRHTGLRDGFEVAFFERSDDGYLIQGHTTAVEEDDAWTVRYEVVLDRFWLTRRATISAWSTVGAGASTLLAECDSSGSWTVDGTKRPDLKGCLDLDLESSAVTNTIPIHRLTLSVGSSAQAPAAYVRAGDLNVERLEQRYSRTAENKGLEYDYEAPRFDFQCRLSYDPSGLIVSYPGIALRAK
jgi:hypothetical protein